MSDIYGDGPGAWVGNGYDEPHEFVEGLWPCAYCGEGHTKREWSEPEGICLWRRQVEEAFGPVGSEIGSETPESTLPTHEKHNTAGIGTGFDERA